MTFAAAKLTELPLRTSYNSLLFSSSTPRKPAFHYLNRPFTTASSTKTNNRRHPHTDAPWIAKWPRESPPVESQSPKSDGQLKSKQPPPSNGSIKPQSSIDRIVLRLRNLGVGSDDEAEADVADTETKGGDFAPVTGEERLGDLLNREWVRPDKILSDEDGDNDMVLPWEREEKVGGVEEVKGMGQRKRRAKAPTLAELTLEDVELRRLRRLGMVVKERISIPKAGLTKEVMQKIHDKWRKEELVRLKFHEELAHDMKTAQEIVERRTGGLVIWKAGSIMMVFRGPNYLGPRVTQTKTDKDVLFVPDVSSVDDEAKSSGGDDGGTSWEKTELELRRLERNQKKMTVEEAEFNSLLDGLGPRFEEWWGTGILPVNGDLLPQKVPGYKTPVRLLPTGMRSRLTNAEITNLRKLAKSLPCHFALGRNRNHQGLALAILKLWEKSLIVKIAVKRGIQNTNNKLMSDELKLLTGGVLLLRNKYYIVMFRGKDFLPTNVATALEERQELTKQIQDTEEKVRIKAVDAKPTEGINGKPLAGTLAEFYEAQARWGREISAEERQKMIEEDSKAKQAKLVRIAEHKLAIAQAKRLRAERLLAKVEASMLPSGPDYDQETITEEERAMFRRVGLRMKAYLPLGVRGVFDGVIENMHLHWKYRELVKLISKQKTLAFVEDSAKLLEYESGGILVAIERVPKGFALIFYRGKNYRRPINLRPRNLLNKAKALKHSVAMQRHEALSQHISELEKTIKQMKGELGSPQEEEDDDDNLSSQEDEQLHHVSEITQSEYDDLFAESDWEDEAEEHDYSDEDDANDKDDANYEDDDSGEDDDSYWETKEDSEFSDLGKHL